MRLEVKNLKKSFGETEVLHGVSLSVESGRALGLLGRNGAGKTTTIRILMDVFKANSGSVTMDGKPFSTKEYKIGYLPEERGVYPKTKIFDQLMYFAKLKGDSKNKVIIERKTNNKQNRIETPLNTINLRYLILKKYLYITKTPTITM